MGLCFFCHLLAAGFDRNAMSFKDRIKIFNRAVARYGMYGSSWLINRMPYGTVRWITHFFIAVGFVFTVRQKRIARESLQIAFGTEKSKEEIELIVRDCFRNLGQGMIELIYFMAHPSMINEKVIIDGKEHLDAVLSQGKGVVAVSAHFGSFPLMLLRLAREGYKTNAIIRPARDQKIEKYFFQKRNSLGLNTIYAVPRKPCVEQSIRVLRNNEILFIPLDQNFGSGGKVFVEFFGHKAATATGPVVFARRTGAPILPMFIIRDHDDISRILIEPPMQFDIRADDDEAVFVNVSRITGIIERYIRRYPHEWGWMHRRWKSRPEEEEREVVSDIRRRRTRLGRE